MAQTSSTRATVFMLLLFLIGLAVTAFAFIDLQWTHWMFVKGAKSSSSSHSSVDPKQLGTLRQSILNVRVQCEGGENTGTGFIARFIRDRNVVVTSGLNLELT